MVTANARTDSAGRQTCLTNFTQEEMYASRVNVWRETNKEFIEANLGDLFSDNKFSLLADYLLGKGYSAAAEIKHRHCSGIRSIKIGGVEYRERKGEIYSRADTVK